MMPSTESSAPSPAARAGPNPWLAWGAALGLLGVAAGAFGAHALRARLAADLLAAFETAARYQLVHALALVTVGVLAERRTSRALRVAGLCFAGGVVLFSGSLYALAFTGARAWGALTPFGGALWLVAWAALLMSALKR